MGGRRGSVPLKKVNKIITNKWALYLDVDRAATAQSPPATKSSRACAQYFSAFQSSARCKSGNNRENRWKSTEAKYSARFSRFFCIYCLLVISWTINSFCINHKNQQTVQKRAPSIESTQLGWNGMWQKGEQDECLFSQWRCDPQNPRVTSALCFVRVNICDKWKTTSSLAFVHSIQESVHGPLI